MPIALYSIRGERPAAVGQRLRHDLLFKWFLNLNIMEASPQFFNQVLSEAGRRRLLSDDHFAVDGTLLEAWASMKSFRPKDGSGDPPEDSGRNPTVDFQGERRINDTHASTTDPEAMLARKGPGREARLSFMGHVLMENRNRLAVDVAVTQATGTVERDAAADMLEVVPGRRPITVGADKNYNTRAFAQTCRQMKVTPHVAQRRYSAIDGRTTRHRSYQLSQRARKRVGEIIGWVKTVGGGRTLCYRGVARNRMWPELTVRLRRTYDLVRMAKLTLAQSRGQRVNAVAV